jgi:hypothetical protein
MKNIFYLLFISLLFISCEGMFPPGFRYVSNTGIKLDKIFKKDYTAVGSYINKKDTIACVYDLGNKRRLTVVKMNNVKNVKTFTAVSNEAHNDINATYRIIESSRFKTYYSNTLYIMDDISSVRFSSNGEIKYNPLNNDIKEVFTTCDTFTIEFNGKHALRMYVESEESDMPMDCLFYEKKGKLYICILTSGGEPIAEHSAYNYLF